MLTRAGQRPCPSAASSFLDNTEYYQLPTQLKKHTLMSVIGHSIQSQECNKTSIKENSVSGKTVKLNKQTASHPLIYLYALYYCDLNIPLRFLLRGAIRKLYYGKSWDRGKILGFLKSLVLNKQNSGDVQG